MSGLTVTQGRLGWKTATGSSKISDMEEASTPLTQPRRKKPFKVSILFAPITVPLLILAAAISIPWTYIHKLKQRRQERKFVEHMQKAGRLMNWEEFGQAIRR